MEWRRQFRPVAWQDARTRENVRKFSRRLLDVVVGVGIWNFTRNRSSFHVNTVFTSAVRRLTTWVRIWRTLVTFLATDIGVSLGHKIFFGIIKGVARNRPPNLRFRRKWRTYVVSPFQIPLDYIYPKNNSTYREPFQSYIHNGNREWYVLRYASQTVIKF